MERYCKRPADRQDALKIRALIDNIASRRVNELAEGDPYPSLTRDKAMNLSDATIGQLMIPVTDPDGNQLGPMSEVILAGA